MTKNLKLSVFYILLFLLILFIHLSLYKYAFDDAYIHFRISGNLLDYGKPYFNIDERLMASSSSGWTILLSALFSIAGKSIKAVALLNAAITTLTVFVFARVAENISGNKKITNDVLVALVSVPVLIYSSVGLMETPAALLLLGAGILFYLRGKGISFLFLSAGVFFRLELAVFLAVIFMHNIFVRKIKVKEMFSYAVAGAAPFIIYNLVYFGTNIPHAVAAKQAIYSLKHETVTFMLFHRVLIDGVTGRYIVSILVGGMNAMLMFRAVKAGPDSLEKKVLILTLPATLIMLSYIIKKVFIFEWYIPLILLPMFIGFFVYSAVRNRAIFAMAALFVFLPHIQDFSRTIYATLGNKAAYPEFHQGARVRKYIEVADRLYRVYPDYTLLSTEMGGLGFGFKGRVLDGAGLLTRNALKYHPMKVPQERPNGLTGAIPPGYVKEANPDIIVSYDSFCGAFMKSPESANYVIIKEPIFTSSDLAITDVRSLWGIDDINIFIKKVKYSKKF